jgi:hypothetical protein
MVVDPLSGKPVILAVTCAPRANALHPRQAKKAKHQERMCAGFHRRNRAGILKLGSRNRSRTGAGTGQMEIDGSAHSLTALLSLASVIREVFGRSSHSIPTILYIGSSSALSMRRMHNGTHASVSPDRH